MPRSIEGHGLRIASRPPSSTPSSFPCPSTTAASTPKNGRVQEPGFVGVTPGSGVSRIDPVSVKQRVVPDPIGELREYVREPGRVDFSNLRITMSESHAQSWIDWHLDFLIHGNCGQDRERSGTLEYLAPNLHDVLMRVQLSNLGIFRLAHEAAHHDGAHMRRVVVDLYCERMELEYGSTVGVAVAEPSIARALDVTPRTSAPQPPHRF